MYTKQQLGKELKENISKTFNTDQIARWAEDIHASHCLELSKELYGIVEILSMMSLGPEFEYSKKQIELLAEKLINNESNVLEQMRKMGPD